MGLTPYCTGRKRSPEILKRPSGSAKGSELETKSLRAFCIFNSTLIHRSLQ